MSGDHNMYGDGTVYRGERSKDSAAPTYTLHELAHAKGVPSMVTSAMLALGQDCLDAQATILELQSEIDSLLKANMELQADAEAWRNFKAKTVLMKKVKT